MAKAGITCDNYKIDKFKEKLKEKGFDNIKVSPFGKTTSLIVVYTDNKEEIKKINGICTEVELHFKQSN